MGAAVNNLPPLPPPDRTMHQYGKQIDHFTADQMRAYAHGVLRAQAASVEPVGKIINSGGNTGSLPEHPLLVWFGGVPPVGTELYASAPPAPSPITDNNSHGEVYASAPPAQASKCSMPEVCPDHYHEAYPAQYGHAGVTAWIGDRTVSQTVTEIELRHERKQGEAVANAASRCLEELAAIDTKEPK